MGLLSGAGIAATLGQTSASMHELGQAVQQNTGSAVQANQRAATASDVAVRGCGVVDELVGTMRDIHDSSRRIGDIAGVITQKNAALVEQVAAASLRSQSQELVQAVAVFRLGAGTRT